MNAPSLPRILALTLGALAVTGCNLRDPAPDLTGPSSQEEMAPRAGMDMPSVTPDLAPPPPAEMGPAADMPSGEDMGPDMPQMCQPFTSAEICMRAGAECDEVTGANGCGARRAADCGDCSPEETCQDNQCMGCPLPTCPEDQCGELSNDCGTRYCGCQGLNTCGQGGCQAVSLAVPEINQATSIALDGDLLVVGLSDESDDDNTGIARVYVRDPNTRQWDAGETILPADGGRSEGQFGASVAILGQRIYIGEPGFSLGSRPATGAVYVFARGGDGWLQTDRLLPDAPEPGERMGAALALDTGALAAGAPGADRVHMFTPNANLWAPDTVLSAPTDDDGDPIGAGFGAALALESGTLAVGAPEGSPGRVVIFERAGEEWVERATLGASASPDDGFGAALALRGDDLLVGAPREGRVHVFGRSSDGSSWNPVAMLSVADRTGDLEYGAAVAWGDGVALVGDPSWPGGGGVHVFAYGPGMSPSLTDTLEADLPDGSSIQLGAKIAPGERISAALDTAGARVHIFDTPR